jgi:hypothetical protein
MPSAISVDRHHLYYSDGVNKLTLGVEWSGVARTEDHPCEFEIYAGELTQWAEPAGEPISPERRESLLDEIAAYYSHPPMADIIGAHGELLRGQSKYRFSLQIYPEPSRYYEVGRFLAIPMAPPEKGAREFAKRYVLDLRGITEWTLPKVPLDRAHLERVVRKIVQKEKIGVIGLTGA